MKSRAFKRAVISVSEIGFGCMSLGQDKSLNERLIHKAIDHGITYFDTADLYQFGENEKTLGRAISGRRDGLVIATKVGNKWIEGRQGWEWTPRKNYILEAAHQSLKRLGVEQIDIYQLHGGTIEDPFDEVLEAFRILKEEGKVKCFGLSSIRPNVFLKLARASDIVSNMMQFSLLDRRPEPYLDQLEEEGVGVVARGALAKGLLANKPISKYLSYSLQDVEFMIDKINLFSIEKMSMSHMALAWVLKHKAVKSALVGVSKMEQLDELLNFAESKSKYADYLEALSQVLRPNRYEAHL